MSSAKRDLLDKNELTGIEQRSDEVSESLPHAFGCLDLFDCNIAVKDRWLVRQDGKIHDIDSVDVCGFHDVIVDDGTWFKQDVSDWAIEHGQNLRHGSDGSSSLDCLAIALAKLTQKMAERYWSWNLAGTNQKLPLVAAKFL